MVQPSVIPAQDSLIGDLLSMDLGAPAPATAAPQQTSAMDLLGGGLDGLVRVRLNATFVLCFRYAIPQGLLVVL